MSRTVLPGALSTILLLLLLGASHAAEPQAAAGKVEGTFVANGKSGKLAYALAMEMDSDTEPEYLDVVVLFSDRPVLPGVAADEEKLYDMAVKEGLVALRLVIDPDAKLKSATPYHPALTAFVSSGALATWEPSAYDEEKVAGHVTTDGMAEAFGQKWQYDLTFSAPIVLDPEAKTIEP